MPIANVTDGVLEQTTRETKKTSGSNLDKDAFLQLLVAQMKYQDPLEPTSNTEYISQLATFSELEEMQNLTTNSDMQRGSALVGKYAIMKVTSSTGNVTYPQGIVDYVVYENGKTMLGINGSEYSLDDLDTVAETDYMEAYSMASALVTALNKLPNVGGLTLDYQDAVESIQKVYGDMNDYQKTFLSEDIQKSIEEYVNKMEELVKLSEANKPKDPEDDGSGGDA